MTYSAEVLADAPVGYWRLGESSGTSAADSSGAGHAGTYTGSPTLAQAGALAGDSDTAVLFGTSKYVDLGNILAGTNALGFSIELLMKMPGGATDWLVPFSPLLVKGDSAWRLHRNSSTNSLQFRASGSANSLNTPAGAPSFEDGLWHHIAAVFDNVADTQTVFVDGVNVASNAYSGSTATNSFAVQIAANAEVGTRFFGGLIDEVAFYDFALSSTRIAVHNAARTGMSVAAPPLLAPALLLPAPATFPLPVLVTAPPMLAPAMLLPAPASFPAPIVITAPPMLLAGPFIPAPTVVVPTRSPVGRFTIDPSQGWGFDLGARIDVSLLEPDDGAGSTQTRMSETYPDPVIVDGRPT